MKLVIHGGFFSEASQSADTKRAKQAAMQRIAEAAFECLRTRSASETVAFAVAELEDDPLFNAGTGSRIQRDGVVRMTAALMEGGTRRFAGVMNIRDVRNPVRVAQALLSAEDRVLGGDESTAYARGLGIPAYDPRTPERIAEHRVGGRMQRSGTVGCVALDAAGGLAAATSTGGKGSEVPGRISDSATVAGNFANRFCAVSCTGIGEDIVSAALAAAIGTRVADGMPLHEAFERTFRELGDIDGFAGAIAVDRHGNVHHRASHPTMVYATHSGAAIEVFG